MSKEYVVMGARLECTHGTAPSNLVILPGRTVMLTGKPKANIGDCKPMANVMPFAMCKSPTNPGVIAAMGAPVPCTPTCSIWLGGKHDVLTQGMPALLTGDRAVCPLGAGMIEVKDSGQGGSKTADAPAPFLARYKTDKKTPVDSAFRDTGGLLPNVAYATGEFEYSYETDFKGRIEKFSTDNLQLTEREARLPHEAGTPGKRSGDHAGHLAGDRFGGSPKLDNLVSQSSTVNWSSYKKLENTWAKAVKDGKVVTVDVAVLYAKDELRPTAFEVAYTIDGPPPIRRRLEN